MDRYLWILLVLTLSLFAIYAPLNIPSRSLLSFKTFVDEYIPLWTPFLVFYLSFYFLLILTFIYLLKSKQERLLKTTLLATILAYTGAYFFYFFFQNWIERPSVIGSNIFDALYMEINYWVAPYNAFPSLHVATSVICATAFYKAGSKYFISVMIWAILICASTVLTKQHYFLDILGGFVLSIVSFLLAEWFIRRKFNI